MHPGGAGGELGEPASPGRILDLLLRVPARGLTNVAFALQVAARQLADVPPRDARVLLLSDCVHDAGPDPRLTAARLPRLDVLLDTSGETTSSWVVTWPGWAGAGCGWCATIATSRGH